MAEHIVKFDIGGTAGTYQPDGGLYPQGVGEYPALTIEKMGDGVILSLAKPMRSISMNRETALAVAEDIRSTVSPPSSAYRPGVICMWTILRDGWRYGDAGANFPGHIICHGTKEQAEELAEYLSNLNAGCTDLFFVAACSTGKP